jgi:hypothetical protein
MLYCAHHDPSARTALVDKNKAANVMAAKIMPMVSSKCCRVPEPPAS